MTVSIIKRFAFSALTAICLITSNAFASTPGHDHGSKPRDDTKGFAVIELFTSEGCSSCPPADDLIARIQKESAGIPIYILAFHVDYWNQAGWKDRFSSSAFTQRQLWYAQALKISGPYTPQAVINGSKEMVGSDETQVRQTINTALNSAPRAQLALNDMANKKDGISFSYKTQGNIANTSLQLALVQKRAVSKVLRGENKGRTLSHVQIVKSFQTIDLKGSGNGLANFSLSPGINASNFEVIAFLQDNATGAIIAATRLPIDQSLTKKAK